MRKVLGLACAVIFAGAALPAMAQAIQTPQPGPATPTLKCADYKHNPDGSWSPSHEVSLEFPDGTFVTMAPGTVFTATGSWMGLPFGLMLSQQCGPK